MPSGTGARDEAIGSPLRGAPTTTRVLPMRAPTPLSTAQPPGICRPRCHSVAVPRSLWPSSRSRSLWKISASALIAGLHARLLCQSGPGFGARFTAAVLGFKALVLIARGSTALVLDAPTTSFLAPSVAQSVYIASHSLTALLTCVCIVLMISERVRAEFEHLASHDGLTGALSRRTAEDALRAVTIDGADNTTQPAAKAASARGRKCIRVSNKFMKIDRALNTGILARPLTITIGDDEIELSSLIPQKPHLVGG